MNKLEEKLGLLSDDPIENFYNDPNVLSLSRVGKPLQTEDMIQTFLNQYDGFGTAAGLISANFLTYEVCLALCQKNGDNLEDVPEKLKDEKLCLAAVNNRGNCIRFVPKELLTYDLCYTAVKNDHSPDSFFSALSFIPRSFLHGKRGRDLCLKAVQTNGGVLRDVPKKYLSKRMIEAAIRHTIVRDHRACWPIGQVPEGKLSRDLIDLSLQLFPESIQAVPLSYLDLTVCMNILDRGWQYLQYIPSPWNKERKIISKALQLSPKALQYVPVENRTKKRCFDAKEKDLSISLDLFPDKIKVEWEKIHPSKNQMASIDLEKIESFLPSIPDKVGIVPVKNSRIIQRPFSDSTENSLTVFYISDIHLEFQIPEGCSSNQQQIIDFVYKNVREMVRPIPDFYNGVLLIAGDVAHSQTLTEIFFDALNMYCPVPYFYVLGNHELWDGNPDGTKSGRPLDEIITSYKNIFSEESPALLENELFLVFKTGEKRILSESIILNSDEKDLSELCEESVFLLLGGTGFSGLNPKYNASLGLYRGSVTLEQDIERTYRFQNIYNKLRRCASDKKVIVLTHTPVYDWTVDAPEPKWIYINGHTHQNGTYMKNATILFDNQVGYKAKKWHLNSFVGNFSYNPFELWKDGIYEIKPNEFIEFNNGRSIHMEHSDRFGYQGRPYMIKRDGFYMFFLKRTNLCILKGKQCIKAEHDLQYYYENFPKYIHNVQGAFKPYEDAIQAISKEVQAIGGTGRVHGCIVDIDFFNHLYLNPYDGKLTPYFAEDTFSQQTFSSFFDLLMNTPKKLPPSYLTNFRKLNKTGKLKILSVSEKKWEKQNLPTVPKIVFEQDIYIPSNTIRQIQYIFDNHVIRLWRDEILTMNADTNFSLLGKDKAR